MIDRHPWILAVAGTVVLAVVLFGVAFGAPPIVDDLVAFLFRPRDASIAGVAAVAYLFHRAVVNVGDVVGRERARRRARAIMARHDRRNA